MNQQQQPAKDSSFPTKLSLFSLPLNYYYYYHCIIIVVIIRQENL